MTTSEKQLASTSVQNFAMKPSIAGAPDADFVRDYGRGVWLPIAFHRESQIRSSFGTLAVMVYETGEFSPRKVGDEIL